MAIPTDKQIKFVEQICNVLGIKDFPMSSRDFTKYSYSCFISCHLNQYQEVTSCYIYEDDLMWQVENDVWCEYY